MFAVLTLAGRGRELATTVSPKMAGELTIYGDVRGDIRFAFYLSDKLSIEDSVSNATESSFNNASLVFDADYPIVLTFIVKDFKPNDSGLEYTATRVTAAGRLGFNVS